MSILITGSRRYDKTSASMPAVAKFTAFSEDQFSSLNASSWLAYDASNGNDTFGHPARIQTYRTQNVQAGSGASSGATYGTSLRLITEEIDNGSGTLPIVGSSAEGNGGTRYSYFAGMLASKDAGMYYPRYPLIEWRAKLPHGQGLWSSFWLTAKNGGASEAEYDLVEYFHSQIPGKNSVTIHGTANDTTLHQNKYTNNGNVANNNWGRTFFEAPTYTPGWHTWRFEIVPVTDATGTTLADPTLPSSYVRLTGWVDGILSGSLVDSTALHYTTNGGSDNSFWNIYLQGCEVDGPYVGHPQDALAYSHQRNACLISGSPGSCAISTGGYTVQRAQFGNPASVVEIDYQRVWKFTG